MKKILTVSIILIIMFTVLYTKRQIDSTIKTTPKTLHGVILPHHNLVGNFIDQFYKEISNNNIKTVILISTNHYHIGKDYIITDNTLDTTLKLDKNLINKLSDQKVISIESGTLSGEHGIKVHIDRLEQEFPNIKILPIIIKWQTPEQILNKFIKAILQEVNMENTLVIASIDFSHFVTEETALNNDQRTKDWLKTWSEEKTNTDLNQIWKLEHSTVMDTKVSTALDSPETLYVFTKLMKENIDLEIWKRTSSLSLVTDGKGDPMQNTSHLFVKVW